VIYGRSIVATAPFNTSSYRPVRVGLRWLGTIGLCASVGCLGTPKILPPRTPPAAVPPPVALPATPLKPGRGRVVIYTTDGPMRVVAEAGQQFQPEAAELPHSGELCVSPCVVDIPTGRYKLYLQSLQNGGSTGDVDDLQVQSGLTYYLRAPGRFDHPTWIPWGPTLLVVAGLLITIAGVGWAAGNSSGSSSATPGLITLGLGVGIMIGGGAYIYDAQRGSIQQGATTQWSGSLPRWEP
jgi:hypothetical protein